MKGKKVLVVGGAGFIGSHLVERLVQEGVAELTIVDKLVHGQEMPAIKDIEIKCYPSDFRWYPRILNNIDVVFNLAVLSLPHSLEYPAENIKNNIEVVMRLLQILEAGDYGKLVHFSSSEVYGSAKMVPMDETHPYSPSTPYAVSKVAGDMLCQSYYLMKKLPVTIIRPFNNFGPRQNSRSYAGVIPLTIKRLMKGLNPIIYGTGFQTRDYVYVKDTVEAALMVARDDGKKSYGEVFNVASGKETSILELVSLISNILCPNPVIAQFEPERSGDVKRHIGCGYKIEDKFGFVPNTDMEKAMEETIEWYLKEKTING